MCPRPFDEDDDNAPTHLQQRFDPGAEANAAFVLTTVDGPDRGRSFRVDTTTPRVFLGTSSTADFRLTDPSVSRRHASLELTGSTMRLKDEGSTNGTWVNGVAVVEATLAGDEQLRLGDDSLHVRREAVNDPERLPARTAFGRVLGGSREMRRLYALLDRIAASTIPVVIGGETGTGKEALAEAIHEAGARANGPFVVFDCTAVAPNLVESELFGHERGAFTGAVNRYIGLMERADGGTLLIDEIGDLDLALQPKLLRAIERREFRRIGGDAPIRVDIRILSATRRNLDREVEHGRFRDDLFHRLAVGRVELPALRYRQGDVSLLADAFCREIGGEGASIPRSVLARWETHSWPGNVRELRNAVARYLALGAAEVPSSAVPTGARFDGSGRSAVANVIDRVVREGLPFVAARQQVLDAFEATYLDAMLERHGGVVTHAARAAGIARRYFQRLRARSR